MGSITDLVLVPPPGGERDFVPCLVSVTEGNSCLSLLRRTSWRLQFPERPGRTVICLKTVTGKTENRLIVEHNILTMYAGEFSVNISFITMNYSVRGFCFISSYKIPDVRNVSIPNLGHGVFFNLIPKFSLHCLSLSLGERPWMRLVT